ncbi:MAG: hypothetical protein ACM3TN_24180 [Alphaproteobacteria bacterium]
MKDEDRQQPATSSDPTAEEIPWGPIRSILEENFGFDKIMSIVAYTGIDTKQIRDSSQTYFGPSTGGLMATIDQKLSEMNCNRRKAFIGIIVEEALRLRSDLHERLASALSRLGWTIVDGRPLPISLIDKSDLEDLPPEAREDFIKATTRFRDGDLTGAVSAACGAVDSLTNKIYQQTGLGTPDPTAFQERVTRSIKEIGAIPRIEADLISLGWNTAKARQLGHNLRGSLNQAANVMQSLRSGMGDVHGSKPALKRLVFECLQWAKLLSSVLEAR